MSQWTLSLSPFVIKRGCARLVQLPGRGETEQERPRRIADRHIKIVTSKMSYAQVQERVVKDSPRSKQEGRKRKNILNMWQQKCRQRFSIG